ncbi:MAG: DUF2336 domain-containing protein [Rhodospirillales bacterium]
MSSQDPQAATYEEAKDLARHPDAAVRRELAARDDLTPELLYFLSQDGDPEVRLAAARNQALPFQADQQLADDTDATVRSGLAQKIATGAPGLTANETDKGRKARYDTLQKLAADQASTVRAILAETLKDVADAPIELIQKLARDAEIEVCGPILESSPLLTDDDLIDIIRSGPPKGAVGAISRRSEVSENVSDAVVQSDDVEAIADLLGNPSAQIREETLDQLLDKAPDIELWHAPLVGRPALPEKAANKLAHFVAENMLDVLTARADLDPKTLDAVKVTVMSRLEQGGAPKPIPKDLMAMPTKRPAGATVGKPGPAPQHASVKQAAPKTAGLKPAGPKPAGVKPAPAAQRPAASGGLPAGPGSGGGRPDFLKVEPPVTVAQRLHKAGKLDIKVITKALHASDHAFVVAAMLVRSGFGMDKLRAAFDTHDPKAITALCWKAGLSSQLAVQIQTRMGGLSEDAAAKPGADGGFAYSDSDMLSTLDALGG